ncbi:hypothetical protein MUY27_00675 [Mucilaginibacter sp. RS28]|uniref:Uncharacterized protein n=1 Tax=Mucilaginibacter straminoryzae TaxID=2932774 RepID=A0A9X2B768_9SPHI|nr:hypothetical protein [Mucilaginibacter straminoryzae]MCJ8208199.1 hypothetical protein [Mucilaginibacter straminoryzae]
MRKLFYLFLGCFIAGGCGMMQQILKCSFPYTTTLTIPAASETGVEHSAISRATSFDQNFSKSGNNATRINKVRMVSAKLQSVDPTNYNLGNISSVKIYAAKANGADEMLVASRSDIAPNAGNEISLDINNANFLDEHVREPNVRVRMLYKLRKKEQVDVSVKVVLSLTADKAEK